MIKTCLIQTIKYQLFECTTPLELTEWRSVLNEAKHQTIFPIAYASLNKWNSSLISPEYETLNASFYVSAIQNYNDHVELHRLLSSNSVQYVILKGQASAMYYPDPILRTAGDVDFLIRENDLQKVDKILNEAGFSKVEDSEEHGFHWAYRKRKSTFELHWKLPGMPADDSIINRYTSTIIDDAILHEDENGSFMVPSIFHHGLVLLLHSLSHLTSTGMGLRHLVDWLVFVNSIEEDEFTELFKGPLQEMGLWRFAQALTRIGVLYFGCNDRQWCSDIGDELCSGILEDILNSGNFGVKDGSRKMQAKFMRNSSTRRIGKESVMSNLLANVNSKARRSFPASAKCPLLLPIGWCVVGIEYIRWSHSDRGRGIDRKTLSEAKRRQKMYAELRLFEGE